MWQCIYLQPFACIFFLFGCVRGICGRQPLGPILVCNPVQILVRRVCRSFSLPGCQIPQICHVPQCLIDKAPFSARMIQSSGMTTWDENGLLRRRVTFQCLPCFSSLSSSVCCCVLSVCLFDGHTHTHTCSDRIKFGIHTKSGNAAPSHTCGVCCGCVYLCFST